MRDVPATDADGTDVPPLAGVRVLSLAQQLPGPFCTMILRDLGAEVIMVEQIPGGDPSRRTAAFFESLNRGKASVAMNLKDDLGCAAFLALVGTADVVIEGFRPGVADRLGVGFDAAKAVNPRIIYCSISGYGQTGADRLRPGHDLSYQARAGAMSASGGINVDLPSADVSSAMFAAIAILAELNGRGDPSRDARFLDISMTESILAFNVMAGAAIHAGHNDVSRVSPTSEPAYGVYETADHAIVLSVAFEQHFWTALCDVLGSPEFGSLGAGERRRREVELRGWIGDRLRTESADSWLRRFEAADVPADAVSDIAAVADDPLLRDRGAVIEQAGARWVTLPMPAGVTRDAIAAGTAEVGAHTEKYLRPLLGDDVYAGCLTGGALATPSQLTTHGAPA